MSGFASASEGKSAQEVSRILTAEIEAKYYCDNDNGKGE